MVTFWYRGVKMTNLFNKEDVKSWSNRNEVKLDDEGYFGYSLQGLEQEIKAQRIRKLSEINEDSGSPFKGDSARGWAWYPFFLPLDKVKKLHTYRPFNNLDEFFNLFYSFSSDSVYSQTEKAEILLGKKIILKKKENGQINAMIIQNIKFNSDNSNVSLNNVSLDHIFHVYDIQKDDKWVTFGVEE